MATDLSDLATYMLFVELGLTIAQTHYNKQHISIADAVNLFHAQTTKLTALPLLVFIRELFAKYGKDLEASLKDSCTSVTENLSSLDGLTDKWLDKLVEKFQALRDAT